MSGNIPDMEILLAGGSTKPAKDLKIGDKVETLHQNTFEKGEHEVTYVRVIESPLLSLNLSDKSFTCAEEDRFYSTNRKGWLHATDLVKGDKISQLDGEVEFKGSTKLGKGESVELTIDEAHTYICHDSRVLLHNKGGGGSPPPPPPPPKLYTEKEYQAKLGEAKKGWHTDRQKVYDTRLAGQKELWGAQEAARKSAYALEQRDLYDTRLGEARGQWHTDAEGRYDRRLGEARTGWHTQAEKAYDTRLGKTKTAWESERDKQRAATQSAFDAKYGTLQGQYGDLQGKYEEEGKSYRGRISEAQKRQEELQGKYDTRGQEYSDLQSRYDTRGQEYDTLQGRYDKRGTDYENLQGRYDKRGIEYGDLQGKYEKRGREYGDLEGRWKQRGREYDTLKGRYGEEKRKRQRQDTGRRRGGGIGSGEVYTPSLPSDGASNSSGLSSDAQRKALLTGDYSFLQTDKGRGRTDRGTDSWKRYM